MINTARKVSGYKNLSKINNHVLYTIYKQAVEEILINTSIHNKF